MKKYLLLALFLFSFTLVSSNCAGYNYLGNCETSSGNTTNNYINNTYINETANLSGYWANNGSSTATGNWDLDNNDLYLNGSLGVGTPTPGSKVEIYGDNSGINDAFRVRGNNGNSGIAIGHYNTSNNSPAVIRTFTSEDLYLSPGGVLNSTPKMVITTSGNVGIGTTNPTYSLTVASNTQSIISAETYNNTAGNRPILLLQRARGTQASPTEVVNGDTIGAFQANARSGAGYSAIAGINFEVDGTFTSGQRPPGRVTFTTAVANGAVTERMRITTAGNVGIGTTNPLSKLHLSVDGSTINSTLYLGTEAFISSSNVNSNFRMIAGGDSSITNSFVMVKSRGTVASPTIVASEDSLGGLVAQGYDGATRRIGAQMTFEVDGTPGSSDMPGRIVFSTTPDGSATPVERLRISQSGNVGIGTTNPTEKLHLQGNALVNGTLITNSIRTLTGENLTIYNSTSNGYANVNAKSFNVFSPEDKAYNEDRLMELVSPKDILGTDGKLERDAMLKGERLDNVAIEDKTKPIYLNVTKEVCEEKNIKINKTIEVIEQVETGKTTLEGEKEMKEITKEEIVEETKTINDCKNIVVSELQGYEIKYQNATSIGDMAFNNRLLISEIKETLFGILNRLTGAEQRITTLETQLEDLNIRLTKLEQDKIIK
jgi:hypothetical protein